MARHEMNLKKSLVQRGYIDSLEQTLSLARRRFRQGAFSPKSRFACVFRIDIFQQYFDYVEIAGWAYDFNSLGDNVRDIRSLLIVYLSFSSAESFLAFFKYEAR